MKYDAQIMDLKNQLQSATRVLVMLPATASVDALAAGLALFLSLQQSGKQTSIVSDADLKVSHSNLYGVGDVTNVVSASGGGNLTLSLEGVVDNDGKVPSLEKLDWFPEGNNLNLVFHVLPGQKFEPINIATKYAGGKFDLIFIIGAANIQSLGKVFADNADKLSATPKVNIDKGNSNNLFGQINIVDAESASLSEMVMQIMQGLSLPLDNDIASNIIAGIYEATANLTQNTKADTFMALGQAMQLGGKVITTTSAPTGGFDISQLNPSAPIKQAPQQQADSASSLQAIPVQMPTPEPAQAPQQPQVTQPDQTGYPQPQAPQVGDLVERKSEDTEQQVEQLQQALHPDEAQQQAAQQYIKSQYETPTGEYVSSGSPENPSNPTPDWLTPKIFKGGNLG